MPRGLRCWDEAAREGAGLPRLRRPCTTSCAAWRGKLLFLINPPLTLCGSCIVDACFSPWTAFLFLTGRVHRKEEGSRGCLNPTLDGLTRQKIE